MKKILFTIALCMTIISVFFVSCKKKLKEDELQTHYTSKKSNARVDAIDGRLVFDTVEEYDSILNYLTSLDTDSLEEFIENLDGWESGFAYTSLRTVKRNDTADLPENDLVLGTILNNRSIVEIEGYIFKVLTNDTFVYSLCVDSMTASDYNYLIEGNYAASQRIQQHSKNDNVFEVLGIFGWGCNESNRKSTPAVYVYTPEIVIPWGQSYLYYRLRAGYTYTNSGIYSKLKIDYALLYKGGWMQKYKTFENQQDNPYIPQNYYMNIHEEYSLRKPKCQSCQSSYVTNVTSSKTYISKSFHGSSKGLHYYYVKNKFALHINSSYTNPATENEFESWKQYQSPWNPCQ